MKPLIWHGKKGIRRESVPDPEIGHPRDRIIDRQACRMPACWPSSGAG